MNGPTTLLLVLLIGGALLALVVLVDGWMDRRPGGRKHDQALDDLYRQERAREALRRQHQAQHIRIGKYDEPRETK